MNSGFKALFETTLDGFTHDEDREELDQKLNSKANETGKVINSIMTALTSVATVATIAFHLGAFDGLQEKFNTDTGSNIQKMELRQIKAV